MTSTSTTVRSFIEEISFVEPAFKEVNTALYELRKSAGELLQKADFPSTLMESWKYTPVKQFFLEPLLTYHNSVGTATDTSFELPAISEPSTKRIILVNGRLQPQLSDSLEGTGIFLSSFSDYVRTGSYTSPSVVSSYEKSDFFPLLNLAGAADGVYLKAGRNTAPISIIFEHHFSSEDPSFFQVHHLIQLQSGSTVQLMHEVKISPNSACVINQYTEIKIEAGAKGNLVVLQEGDSKSCFIARTEIRLYKDSEYSTHTYTLSGAFTRNEVNCHLLQQGASVGMFGFYQTQKEELCDNHTLARHAAAYCSSNELYKGILAGKSTAVFNGKVLVELDAQKTNAFQQNDSIILGNEASMNAKPELEIYADDVKCSHGSTTGQLDSGALFYLQSRGIGETSAKQLLIRAFAEEVTSKLTVESFKGIIEQAIERSIGHSL